MPLLRLKEEPLWSKANLIQSKFLGQALIIQASQEPNTELLLQTSFLDLLGDHWTRMKKHQDLLNIIQIDWKSLIQLLDILQQKQ